jgi:hypothetical protein
MSDPNREGEEFARARRGRNIAIAIGLVAFVAIVYIVSIVRMGGSVLERSF